MPPKKRAAPRAGPAPDPRQTRARPAKQGATKVAKPATKRVASTKPAKSKKRVGRPKTAVVAERVASADPAEPMECATPAPVVREGGSLPKEEPSADSFFRAANAAL